MQGLQLSAQGLARPGDAVILEEFEYGGTIRVFKQYGLELVGVPLDDDGMRMDALADDPEQQDRIGQRPAFIYTTASYQNPTGTTPPLERRQRLVELAAQVRAADRRGRHLRRHQLRAADEPASTRWPSRAR